MIKYNHVQLLLTLPLSLFVLLVHNWLLGKFFCFALPMLQVVSSMFFSALQIF